MKQTPAKHEPTNTLKARDVSKNKTTCVKAKTNTIDAKLNCKHDLDNEDVEAHECVPIYGSKIAAQDGLNFDRKRVGNDDVKMVKEIPDKSFHCKVERAACQKCQG